MSACEARTVRRRGVSVRGTPSVAGGQDQARNGAWAAHLLLRERHGGSSDAACNLRQATRAQRQRTLAEGELGSRSRARRAARTHPRHAARRRTAAEKGRAGTYSCEGATSGPERRVAGVSCDGFLWEGHLRRKRGRKRGQRGRKRHRKRHRKHSGPAALRRAAAARPGRPRRRAARSLTRPSALGCGGDTRAAAACRQWLFKPVSCRKRHRKRRAARRFLPRFLRRCPSHRKPSQETWRNRCPPAKSPPHIQPLGSLKPRPPRAFDSRICSLLSPVLSRSRCPDAPSDARRREPWAQATVRVRRGGAPATQALAADARLLETLGRSVRRRRARSGASKELALRAPAVCGADAPGRRATAPSEQPGAVWVQN